MSRRFGAALFVAVLAGTSTIRILAHDLQNDLVVEAYVKADPQRLHVLVRVPTALLADANLPKIDGPFLDLSRIDESLGLVARNVPDVLEVWEEGAPLGEPATRWIVSTQDDASFATYEAAVAHLRGPHLPPNTKLLTGEGFADFALEYPVDSVDGRFSARLNGFHVAGLPTRTILHYIASPRTIRTFSVAGEPERVFFDPHWYQAALRTASLGLERLLNAGDLLWFVFCLIVPLRRIRTIMTAFMGLAAGQTFAIVASTWNLAPSSPAFLLSAQMLAAATLVIAGAHNVTTDRTRWLWLIGLGFGLVSGFALGSTFRETLPFAGSHVVVSWLTFVLVIELGQLWILIVAKPAVELLYRYRWAMSERMTTIVLSALVVHAGLHRLVESGQLLAEVSWPTLNRSLILSVSSWALALVAIGLFVARAAALLDPPQDVLAESGAALPR